MAADQQNPCAVDGCTARVTGRYWRGVHTGYGPIYVDMFDPSSKFGEPMCKTHALAKYRTCCG